MKKLDKKAFEPLDDYEQELIEYIENNDLETLKISTDETKEFQKIAKNTLDKLEEKKRISINIRTRDLEQLKQKAKSSSIPYQNLIQALVNNYVQGKIKLEI